MADRQIKNGMIRRFRRPENAKCGVSANCKRKAAFQTEVGAWANGEPKKHQQPTDIRIQPTEARRFQTTSNSARQPPR
ncbi:hypothetical protein NEISICOT_03647 [Neisseria sicca ATCC 29256]|uniref:Uncharacterized protein n=1 Tax=Neisseria sicca ATCC 29256 TaxID=547045 RepID=C6MAR6_NEISI|nr:hypothetical protein [Neisseria sicca]EET42597.1 hypothetical protein NEISICOT_03647 [Neisseria sicca ATCC 29256]QMT38829.1 hypothetical protein H3L95_04290 [Neisseria sicca]